MCPVELLPRCDFVMTYLFPGRKLAEHLFLLWYVTLKPDENFAERKRGVGWDGGQGGRGRK